jgi:hypothetical protein
MNAFEQFIDSIKDDGKQLAKTELKDLVSSAKQDKSDFVRQQAESLERWTMMLANEEITPKGYKQLVGRMKVLTELESIQLSISAKASAQRLAGGIKEMVIKSLFSLI